MQLNGTNSWTNSEQNVWNEKDWLSNIPPLFISLFTATVYLLIPSKVGYMMMGEKRVTDICCGGGYFSYGFKQAGYEIQEGIDHWPTALKTYTKYIKAPGHEIGLQDYFPTKKDFDAIIIGATPCQDFTRLNNRRDIFSKRAQLVVDFCRIVNAVKPDVFVYENVIGLPKYAAQAILDIPGYKTTMSLIDAVFYGVPQHRRRKIFIGSKTKHIRIPTPPNPRILTVRDAFDTIPENWGLTKHRPETVEKFKGFRSPSWKNKDPTLDYQGTIRLRWDHPSCVIVNIKKAQILHPDEDRIISIAEAMALQGIPSWYIPCGTDTDKAVQVSNAHPPALAYHIATTITARLG